MLKVYGWKQSSNVQKVLWCCDELGIEFEHDEMGGPLANNRSPAYLALNPNGLVPTIDEDGFILWESNVVVRYLSSKFGAGRLCPTDLAARADAERWMDWQQTALAPPMGVLFRALLRHPAENTPAEQLQAAMQKATAAWKILDARLQSRPYVGGATLTMGDIALGNAVHRWFRMPLERPPFAHVDAWYQRLRERPSYQQRIAPF